MSVTAGTYLTYATKGRREELHNTIYNISPEQVPFSSSISHKSTSSTIPEWQTDSLAAVDTTNAKLEGAEFEYTTPDASVRVGNHTQILSKTARVSRTNEKTSKAGRASEMAYQVMKRGKEIKRDLEAIMLINQGGNAGSASVARLMASLPAWLKTATNFYTTDGADPTYTAGVPSAARTDGGTLRAFSETIGKNVMQLAYTEGGEPTTLMVGPYNKTVASTFAGIADHSFNLNSPKAAAVISTVDVWVTDFGTLRIVTNRFQRERDALFLDFNQIELLVFDALQTVDLAKTGDATQKGLIMEATLKVKAENGIGAAYDLTTA